MTDAVRDFLAAYLENVERIVDPPEPPLGFGSDMSCVDDLTEDMAEVDGRTTRALAEALIRRIGTPRGSVLDAPDYGIDLRSYLHRGSTQAELLGLAGDVANEWRKDDRVERVEVEINVIELGRILRGRGRVYPADPSINPFTLTFGITDAAVAIEEIYG